MHSFLAFLFSFFLVCNWSLAMEPQANADSAAVPASGLVSAKMAPMQSEKIGEVIGRLEKQQPKDQKLGEVLEWSRLARDGFQVQEIRKQVGLEDLMLDSVITYAIREKILGSGWKKLDDARRLKKIRVSKPSLEKEFGSASYPWAWILFQLGETEKSKSTLQRAFQAEHDRIMKLTGIVHGMGHGNPMLEIDRIEQALSPMSAENEKAELTRKLKALKVHVSNLPNFQIMT